MAQQKQEVDKWKTVYKEVRGALDLRVANLNYQQQSIANCLFVNGLIFGFLGASAGIFFDPKVPKWPTSILYVASMCSLALGLVAAVAALWPYIEPLGVPLSLEEQKTNQFLRWLGRILAFLAVNPNIKLVGEYKYSGGFGLSLASLFLAHRSPEAERSSLSSPNSISALTRIILPLPPV